MRRFGLKSRRKTVRAGGRITQSARDDGEVSRCGVISSATNRGTPSLGHVRTTSAYSSICRGRVVASAANRSKAAGDAVCTKYTVVLDDPAAADRRSDDRLPHHVGIHVIPEMSCDDIRTRGSLVQGIWKGPLHRFYANHAFVIDLDFEGRVVRRTEKMCGRIRSAVARQAPGTRTVAGRGRCLNGSIREFKSSGTCMDRTRHFKHTAGIIGTDAHAARGADQELVVVRRREWCVRVVRPYEGTVVRRFGLKSRRKTVRAGGRITQSARDDGEVSRCGVISSATNRGTPSLGHVRTTSAYSSICRGRVVASAANRSKAAGDAVCTKYTVVLDDPAAADRRSDDRLPHHVGIHVIPEMSCDDIRTRGSLVQGIWKGPLHRFYANHAFVIDLDFEGRVVRRTEKMCGRIRSAVARYAPEIGTVAR